MAFGIKRAELVKWKRDIDRGEIAFLTHYWVDDRFHEMRTVTKAGAMNIDQLSDWGSQYGLKKEWIHIREDGYSHYDLIGDTQLYILKSEGLTEHIERFKIK
ncbi:hypothetical protein JMA_18070 [Jeotgalibacillus malaysiensis]|uniref:YneQ n=1 Tax=Jeotgalibacillus malaysiensis TaxID=1508404 RepID=A0A0B5ASW6_9BACL|nr:hypothetical protein [Jeotgalibacillus malaysiensis]AJD91124.1 hypothetical protein JMA_18070 [Jeotgalibacillus malaysiensis]